MTQQQLRAAQVHPVHFINMQYTYIACPTKCHYHSMGLPAKKLSSRPPPRTKGIARLNSTCEHLVEILVEVSTDKDDHKGWSKVA